MRSLARAAGVSVPPLRHYFPSADALLADCLFEVGSAGNQYTQKKIEPDQDNLEDSLRSFLMGFCRGWEKGISPLVTAGLGLGLQGESAGEAFVQSVLEPILQSLERRLGLHQKQGLVDPETDLRLAALMIFSPVFLALLHQGPLGGSRCRPLDVQEVVEAQVAFFSKAQGGHRNNLG